MNLSQLLARRRMRALTKAVYDSAVSQEDEAADKRVARLLPGGATVAALILVLVLITAVSIWKHAGNAQAPQREQTASETGENGQSTDAQTGPTASPPTAGGQVTVYVSGAVASPGVLTLPASSRIIDAIDAAGGALPDADLDSLNLARVLVDGEHIRLTHAGQSPDTDAANEATASCVRLDTASDKDLQTLPGIGPALASRIILRMGSRRPRTLRPALASRIIQYRTTHPRITSVDALDEVPGIGPALIEKIRPGVCP